MVKHPMISTFRPKPNDWFLPENGGFPNKTESPFLPFQNSFFCETPVNFFLGV